MEGLHFSFIVPVFNRPEEVKELLESFTQLEGSSEYEIVIVEDGSTMTSKAVVDAFRNALNVSYFYKENSGPGDSRNYGMNRAKGNYFIILDSDCLLPKNYLAVISKHLNEEYVDCFGGIDAAHDSFSDLQKAINFAMTSFLTTGGVRGSKHGAKKFQPRSFNMGISKVAFQASGGFGTIHPGEDPDLSIRLNTLGFKTYLMKDAKVFHKRRISWSKFFRQVYKFGMVRPILNSWYPETKRFTYWFPSIFNLGLLFALLLSFLGYYWLLVIYGLYFLVVFLMASVETKSVSIGAQSLVAVFVQFLGYGYGFLKSTFIVEVLKKKPEECFPNLFFKHVN